MQSVRGTSMSEGKKNRKSKRIITILEDSFSTYFDHRIFTNAKNASSNENCSQLQLKGELIATVGGREK
jgi:hypothetical protein